MWDHRVDRKTMIWNVRVLQALYNLSRLITMDTWQKITTQSCRCLLWRGCTKRCGERPLAVYLRRLSSSPCKTPRRHHSRQGKGRTWPCVCVVERWQPHAEACTLCLSLNRGRKATEEKKKKHYQLLSPWPTPFQQLIRVTVQVTLRLQCGHWAANADEVDLLTETQRYAITWGKQKVMMAKL